MKYLPARTSSLARTETTGWKHWSVQRWTPVEIYSTRCSTLTNLAVITSCQLRWQ